MRSCRWSVQESGWRSCASSLNFGWACGRAWLSAAFVFVRVKTGDVHIAGSLASHWMVFFRTIFCTYAGARNMDSSELHGVRFEGIPVSMVASALQKSVLQQIPRKPGH